MRRRFVDISVYVSRKMEKDGNIDYKYWFDKTNEERVRAASIMTATAYGEPDFFRKKVDRTVFSSRKHHR